MQNDTGTVRQEVWTSLEDKAYRDAFVSSHLATNVASQIYSLRESHGWTQKDLADRTGMAQTRISILENPEYDNFKIDTLKRVASAFDVALIVRFVPFSELVEWVTTPNPKKLIPIEYVKDCLPPPTVQYGLGQVIPGAYVQYFNSNNTSTLDVFSSAAATLTGVGTIITGTIIADSPSSDYSTMTESGHQRTGDYYNV